MTTSEVHTHIRIHTSSSYTHVVYWLESTATTFRLSSHSSASRASSQCSLVLHWTPTPCSDAVLLPVQIRFSIILSFRFITQTSGDHSIGARRSRASVSKVISQPRSLGGRRPVDRGAGARSIARPARPWV